MSEVKGPSKYRHSRRRRRHRWLMPGIIAALALGAVAYGAIWLRHNAPLARTSPAQLLSRAAQARIDLRELSFTLSTPWPQANPAVSAAAGAKALLGPVEGERTWHIRWHYQWGLRAEVLEPSELAGTVTIISPETYWVYSPLLKVALTGPPAGFPALYIDQLLTMAAGGRNHRLLGRVEVGGREAHELAVTIDPAVGSAEPLELRLSLDVLTGLPVQALLSDGDGRRLGTLQVSAIEGHPALGPDDFAFAPPGDTKTLGLGTLRAYPSLAAATVDLPFEPQLPAHLPAGFSLQAVNILGDANEPALVLTYLPADGSEPGSAGASGLLSITQSLVGPDYQPLAYGMPQQQDGWSGQQFELGELRVVDWRSGPLALTIFGTASYAELRRVAASMRPSP